MAKRTMGSLTGRHLDRAFREAANGYGFEEVEQEAEGLYCDGCCSVHLRPTKMYSDGRHTMCKYAVAYFYGDQENQ